jgi:hypothetical protein
MVSFIPVYDQDEHIVDVNEPHIVTYWEHFPIDDDMWTFTTARLYINGSSIDLNADSADPNKLRNMAIQYLHN